MANISHFKFHILHIQLGFTLPELIITLALLATLTGYISINLLQAKQSVSLSTTVDQVISDIKSQQLKAMVGDTEGRTNADRYGVHFDATGYVLFHGSTYIPGDSANTSIALDNSIQFASPGTDVIFSQLSGKISNATTITLTDTTNSRQKTIQLNTYGVVTGVN